MANLSINPPEIGAAVYRFTGTPRVLVDFIFDVPISAPFPTFDLEFPVEDKSLEIALIHDSVSVNLHNQQLTDFPAFPNRLISTVFSENGPVRTLSCEIKAVAAVVAQERFQLLVKGRAISAYALTQIDNNPVSPTIRNIRLFRPAEIVVSGDAVQANAGWKVHEKGLVKLEVIDGPALELNPPSDGDAASARKYLWKHNGGMNIPELAENQRKPAVSFFAPPVSQTKSITFEVEITSPDQSSPVSTLSDQNPAVKLVVEPLGTNVKIGEINFIKEDFFSDGFPKFSTDSRQGIWAVWDATETGTESNKKQIFVSRLDQYDPQAGFQTPVFQITSSDSNERPYAVFLPNGQMAVIYLGKSEAMQSVRFKSGLPDQLPTAAELEIASDSEAFHRTYVVWADGLFVFLYRQKNWLLRRFSPGQGWLDEQAVQVFESDDGSIAAIADEADKSLWLATINDNFLIKPAFCLFTKIRLSTGEILLQEKHEQKVFGDCEILPKSPGDIWFFWGAGSFLNFGVLVCWRAQNDVLNPVSPLPDQVNLTEPFPNIKFGSNTTPCVVTDSRGGIWLFWVNTNRLILTGRQQPKIFFSRRAPESGNWSMPKLLGDGDLNEVFITPNDTIWVFGYQTFLIDDLDPTLNPKPKTITKHYYRRIFTKF